eukprot:CAMPEP_0119051336 /NCGR_PEP_ID=MMETSP1177-20130426/72987_1 /TAXON_ID=2985 /ORGANISM="Ochromonas sp, Strain CCMP1899" /LENGTH=236 /DNA_ID=CAMNT_0007030505 /DNA_START=452 /DNA_END=1162 /DNA_ORIENTATION=+
MGFPGVDKEFEEINEFFQAANVESVLDLSCGSGFMTRKFVGSNNYKRVIAGDLSPTMLQETRRRCVNEGITVPEMIRCDSSRLPFATNSLDAIHAGAALHCWPRLSEALSEVYRVLKPGGLFFASTIFVQGFGRADDAESSGFYLFKDEEEITDLTTKAGFAGEGGASVVRREGRACAIIKAVKSPVPDSKMFTDLYSSIPSSTADITPSEGSVEGSVGSVPSEGSSTSPSEDKFE